MTAVIQARFSLNLVAVVLWAAGVELRILLRRLRGGAVSAAVLLGPDDEPQDSGTLVAVHHGDRDQEVWVRSRSNIGNWYPLGSEYGRPRPWDDPRSEIEKLTWTGPAPHPGPGEVPRHPHWEDVLARGPVTLLVPGERDAYRAGWRNGRRQLAQQVETLSEEEER